MSKPIFIYEASPGDAAELRRVLKILLASTRVPRGLSYRVGDFGQWADRVFFPIIAPHALGVWKEARKRDGEAILAADAALILGSSSHRAGRVLLEARQGAVHLPVIRRFLAGIAGKENAGNFATVLALYAYDFSIAALPLLQALLYCEWCGGQGGNMGKEIEDFLCDERSAVQYLPKLITLHAPVPPALALLPQPTARQRRGR